MENYVFSLIGAIFISTFSVVSWNKLLNKKINFRDYKFYLSIVLLVLFCNTFGLIAPQYLKVFVSVVIMFIINYIFFCRNFTKNLLTILFSEIMLVVSEFILAFLLSLFMGNYLDIFATSNVGILSINIGVALVAFIFLKFKFIYIFFNYLIKTFDNMKRSNLLIYFILTIVLISIFLIIIHMDLPLTFLLTSEILLTLLYIVMLFRLANARENYKNVTSKYETSLSSLREYEEIMDKYRVANHENKNQLLTIRNMVNKKDKQTTNYIDNLVDNKIRDNETIFYKTSKIPEGGLRAIIYSKLCKVKDMNIKYQLDISNDVKTENLIKVEDSTMLNICKIVGVFLDNAIEAVENLNKRNVIIEMFIMSDYLCIDISNNYEGNIEVDKINNKGYTTKGKNHGYGLTLVKNIIKEDDNLEHETEISKNKFTQRLKIKM